jgi:hypothetical protein
LINYVSIHLLLYLFDLISRKAKETQRIQRIQSLGGEGSKEFIGNSWGVFLPFGT